MPRDNHESAMTGMGEERNELDWEHQPTTKCMKFQSVTSPCAILEISFSKMIICKRRKKFISHFCIILMIYTVLWYKLFLEQSKVTELTAHSVAVGNASTNGSDSIRNIRPSPGRNTSYSIDLTQSRYPHINASEYPPPRVAIGLAVTSKGMGAVSDRHPFKNLQLFSVLITSFCETASQGFEYHIYVAYDYTDRFFVQNRARLQQHFGSYLNRECEGIHVSPDIRFLECGYTGRPAWSQADVMMQAYLDGNDYFYRVNDDSRMDSSNWTEEFIEVLRSRDPPNVGVVGPEHRGGNTKILTHDFVHKTHIEIFGLYYPRCYSDLYADTWISKVYPKEFTSKLHEVQLTHTQSQGKRYTTRIKPLCHKIRFIIGDEKAIFERYLLSKRAAAEAPAPDGTKVIAMSVHGSLARHTVGVVRNAQLVPVMFPGWRLRVYTAGPINGSALSTPQHIVDRLNELGAEIILVHPSAAYPLSPAQWPYSIVDDTSVKYFIIRNPDGRLSRRDFAAVSEWMAHGVSFHFMRDQKFQLYGSVREGLWGGKNPNLRKHLPFSMKRLLITHIHSPKSIYGVLEKLLLAAKSDHLVHDGYSCGRHGLNCRPFPVHEYYRVGQIFDEVHRAIRPSRTM